MQFLLQNPGNDDRIAIVSKTGGGPGSNQFGPRGRGKVKQPTQQRGGVPSVAPIVKLEPFWAHNPYSPKFRPYGDDIEECLEESWWPDGINPENLPPFPMESWRHILDGDPQYTDIGGLDGCHLKDSLIKRHERRTREGYRADCDDGKTTFPEHWGAAQIGESVQQVLKSVAEDAHCLPKDLEARGTWERLVDVGGYRLWVLVSLDYDYRNRRVITAYPLRGDGVQVMINGKLRPLPLNKHEE